MQRGAKLERWLAGAAYAVGDCVVRGCAALPAVASAASGIAAPSVTATTAGIVRGTCALAPFALGPIAGGCVDAIGVAAVLALATWTLDDALDGLPGHVVDEAIATMQLRDLCRPATAALWRAALARPGARSGPVLRTIARAAAGVGIRALLARSVFASIAELAGASASVLNAWSEMGRAASIITTVEAIAASAIERARASERPAGAEVIWLNVVANAA